MNTPSKKLHSDKVTKKIPTGLVVLVAYALFIGLIVAIVSLFNTGNKNTQTSSLDGPKMTAQQSDCLDSECSITGQEEAAYEDYILDQQINNTCKIKGNISFSSGEKIYHMPYQKWYDSTLIEPSYGEKYFCTEQEAISAGWRKSYE